jgi:hypothetical protein
MTFFARPNLDDVQFKQLTGSTLTLSGETNFKGVLKSKGVEIDGTATSIGNVLTFDGSKIKLMPSTSGGSSGIYYGKTPAAVCVGGIPVNYVLTGKTITCIIQDMLVPELYPALGAPSYSFSVTPTGIFEVGRIVSTFCASASYNRGTITPPYGTNGFRSGPVSCYTYLDFNATPHTTITSSPTDTYTMTPRTITVGNNTAYGCVTSLAGQQPSGSTGTPYCAPYGACTTSPSPVTVTGVYPWFWGSSLSAPTAGQALINAYTCKCVANSAGSINVDNFNVTGRYIWFAIPFTSNSKTSWQGANNPSNNGVIPGGLFPAATCMNITSPESCWGSTCYKIYMSNYATSINYGMAFSN